MIDVLVKFTGFIIDIFSPPYLYTLDRNHINKHGGWLFKEFGTHTYIVKTWKQMQFGDFIKEVNPKDLYYIAEMEAMEIIKKKNLRIIEEKRNGTFVLSCGGSKINVTGADFLNNNELINKTNSQDAIRIAYLSGFRKGREISRHSMMMNRDRSDVEIH